jgi:hypothetical protein
VPDVNVIFEVPLGMTHIEPAKRIQAKVSVSNEKSVRWL